jgi:hypothetical protein
LLAPLSHFAHCLQNGLLRYSWTRIGDEAMSADGKVCTIRGLRASTTYVARVVAVPAAGGSPVYSNVSSYMMTVSEKEDASKRRAEFLKEVERDREALKTLRDENERLKADARR